MTGRGDGKLCRPSPNASVTIGLTLSTSPQHLSLSSIETEPFYIIVTARILSTPHPNKPITLQTHPSPLDELSNRSFNDIICTSNPDKRIHIFPTNWPHYIWDSEDLRKTWAFVTIPPKDQGSYSVQHQVPRDKIKAAAPQKGERYSVSLTNKCLGTRWFAFAGQEELQGSRLRAWKSQAALDVEAAEAKDFENDPEYLEELEAERREKYGDSPAVMGEEPEMLAMVVEGGDVEFEFV